MSNFSPRLYIFSILMNLHMWRAGEEMQIRAIHIGFFSTQTTGLILNNSVGKYFVEPIEIAKQTPLPLDARVTFQDGQLVITSLNLNKNSSTLMLTLGERIKSINGRQASDFTDNCQFLIEYYHTHAASIQIEQLNGSIITVKRSELL